MKKIIILLLLPLFSISQEIDIKKYFKFSTFYGAINGGTSISDVDVFSVTDGLTTTTIQTPYDYNITLGVRKIARFGYENKANTFYDGTESNYSDAATIGKIKGLEFLFEANYKRQEGVEYLDQHHFIRYVGNNWNAKVEYLKDGFADVDYFEGSQRYRYNYNNKLSFNIGAVQRIAEPYGYDPLEEWKLDNGNIHYTYLALQEGYNVDVYHQMYYNADGNLVAVSSDVWEQIVIPKVLSDYTERKRNELDRIWNYSLVVGFDYYYYKKDFWLHSWGNLMPYHYDNGNEYAYHNFIGGQWYDYSGGTIFGKKLNKQLGVFVEGKYNKYWNREWYNFKLGINYIIR
jgi:hypothetical protein|tara:strand:- start:19809 stop:20843 length:1035 start_codon:yes stop_codon:yes gene_type:complete